MKPVANDSLATLKADMRSTISAHGPLRLNPFVQDHFWSRLAALKGPQARRDCLRRLMGKGRRS